MADRPLPTQRLGAGGRGPGSSARSPPAAATHTRTHTLPCLAFRRHGWSRAAPSVRVQTCGDPALSPSTFPEAAQAAVGSRGSPCLVINREKEQFFVEIPLALRPCGGGCCQGPTSSCLAHLPFPW